MEMISDERLKKLLELFTSFVTKYDMPVSAHLEIISVIEELLDAR